ncbi:hypothetical protein F2Q70_00031886 [Brassica cretica]|uniref:Uncharacterized protein n=1 Tax=Brassica cretica TaxID=69181 RepID=A0A8S9FLB4_BRACR|nr:hypothetical protein F2Q70_00031886 [Brassica cretica]
MATFCMSSAPIYINGFTSYVRLRRFACKSMTKRTSDDVSVDLCRRSVNYQPSPWDHHSLLAITNKYAEVITRDVLKKKVKKILAADIITHLEQLELIDDLQKIGISHHFELEIKDILTDFHHINEINLWKCDKEEDLHATALEFRLLSQYGFDISEDVFDVIVEKIESDTFKSDDMESIITLYEASYLSTKSDTKLYQVIRPFAIEQLREYVNSDHDNETYKSRETAIHALEMPYHWRMRRLETRWYIDAYEKKHDMNLALMELAKIDFNIIQASYQEELKYATSWWKETCLSNQLPFVRDVIVENYFWNVGIIYETQFGYTRRILTIINALVTTIDDIYDIYGTLEELELFTAMNEKEVITRDVLKKKMKKILDVELKTSLEKLELIDDLQKLGISHHFELEIKDILTDLHHKNEKHLWNCDKEEDLHATALEFRLLRQHGFEISEDVFDVVVNKIESATFKSDDIKSIITLYEASYLSSKSDTKLYKVIRPFATEQLRDYVNSNRENETYQTREKAIHALEMPYHWRMRRLETRWYIDAYEKIHDMNLALMELAKIDFNIVQANHQEELKYVFSWWQETCLSNQLPFVRDEIVENYFWNVGIIYEPQFGYTRRILTIINALVTTIDDIYDIYGTLEELELFTAMVDK